MDPIRLVNRFYSCYIYMLYMAIVVVIVNAGWAVGKTGRGVGVGVGDYWVKPGDWELGDHVNEVFASIPN